MTKAAQKDNIPYNPGHPWYYVLGGRVQMPREIFNAVKASGYRGWREEDIEKASRRQEPARSVSLRKIREASLTELFRDMSVCRKEARKLRFYRMQYEASCIQRVCADEHVNISLKYNHLYNDFAHLIALDEALSYQPDLFEGL